jgi:TonB family protein
VPERKILAGFSDISFLGPILGEEVLISPRTLEKLQPIEKKNNKSFGVKKTVSYEDASPKTKLLAQNFFRDLASSSNKSQTHTELSKMNLGSKTIPNLFSSSGKSSIKSSESPLPLIEGPIRSRGIIYRPPLPKPKRWTERSNQYTDAELKFLVSPEGKVLYVEKILSSGDPEVDLLWMRYIKRWRFLPEHTNINQWGKIRLNFDLE